MQYCTAIEIQPVGPNFHETFIKVTMEAGAVDNAATAELLKLSTESSPFGGLDGLKIDRKIGKGQFSVVYRAKALHSGKTLALKKVQIFEMMDSKARLDCMKEIQLLQVGLFIAGNVA